MMFTFSADLTAEFVDSLLSDITVGSLHEFVAADTEILLAGSSADAGAGKQSGGGIYQIIALAVTEAVVYVFLSVQVGHYQQKVLPPPPGASVIICGSMELKPFLLKSPVIESVTASWLTFL